MLYAVAGRTSAGLLLHRVGERGTVEVLLGHPGGPFWSKRDAGAWSVPKGELEQGEEPLAAARREFAEETGTPPPSGVDYVELGEVRQRNGKTVLAWAVAGDVDATTLVSNTVEIDWPPRSGRRVTVPEIDRFAWFGLDEAREKINAGQVPLLDRLADLLG